MTDEVNQQLPNAYIDISEATQALGFTMASDIKTCSFLRTLAASKPGGQFLELGTGTGLSTSWILDGMDDSSLLISLDHDVNLHDVASRFLGGDKRLELVTADGEDWINNNKQRTFDFIFADTWHGKYLMLEEVLSMLTKGGFYVLDDMLPQSNWPVGHHEKAINLINYLETRKDLLITKQGWATGIVVAVKK